MFYYITISLINSLLLKMALYVLGYWVGIHFYGMVPQFSTVFFLYSVKFESTFLHVAVFVKIPFQHINYPCMLRICRPHFMKFKDR